MQLYYADTSPYARKVRMVILEKELKDGVELVFANPFEDNPALKAANPLGKVPTLVTGDGQALFDSSVICAYLDEVGQGPRLYPQGEAVWEVRRAEALCDGMLDALFALVMEGRRPQEQRSRMWQDRWREAFLRSTNVANDDLAVFEGELSIAHLALGAVLGYADFRLPEIDWRHGRPALAGWYDTFSDRDVMKATDPPAA